MTRTILLSDITTVAALAIGLSLSHPAFAADDTYEVRKTDVATTVGSKGKAQVTISAKKGWHLNAEAPFTLKLAPAPGISVDKAKLGRADLALSSETSARFDVGVTPSEPGNAKVEAEASFVLCQENACRPVKEKLTLAVDATVEKAAPAKKPGKKK
jgi:hypothetical protein